MALTPEWPSGAAEKRPHPAREPYLKLHDLPMQQTPTSSGGSCPLRQHERYGTRQTKPAAKTAGYRTMEARTGFEPVSKGFANLRLTTWLPRRTEPFNMAAKYGLSIRNQENSDLGAITLF